MAASTFSLPAGLPTDPALFSTLLDLLPMGVIYYTPVVDATGTLTDLQLAYLNPAAQRMTGLPAQPGTTYRQQFPTTDENGAWDFHRRTWLSGEPQHFQFYYDADGFDAYFRVASQRLGEGLLAIFTDTQDEVRSQAEQALLASQARERAALAEAEHERSLLQALLTQAPLVIGFYTGDDLHVVAASTLQAELMGSTVAQVVGRPLLEGAPELRGQGFDDLLRQVMATQVPFSGTEMRAVTQRAGQLHTGYYNSVYQPLYAADHQVLGVMSVAVEVTAQVLARQQVEQLNQALEGRVQARTAELVQAQAETDAQRHRLARLVAEAPALIASLRGPEHVVELANEGFRAIFGWRELVGKTYREAIPEFASQPFFDRLDAVYRTGETYYGIDEPVILDRTNSGQLERTFITYTYQATRDAQGQIDGILVFCYEVTDQVLARQEREAQRGELQRLFEQAPVAIAVFRGPQYVIELANPPVCAIWGRTLAQTLGTPLFELLPEAAGQGFEELLDQVRATGEPFVAHEMPALIDRHGRRDTVYWNFVYAPLREADGTIERVTVVATDGTEQVLARQQMHALNAALTTTNDELGTSNRQLTRTNIDLDNFIYTASHDLKAPITNIEGLLLALEHELPAAARTGDVPLMLTMMQDAVDRFRRTIDHLTDLSRLQKEHSPDRDAVALAPVVEAVRLDLMPLLTQTQGQLTVSMPEGLTVTFAEKNLRSVVYNLLSNAFKYRHPDRVPEVVLRSWLAEGYAVLEVQDNGLGLDLAQGQEKLFAMFQRLHTHVEGTGVGLYMVKRIMENAGGRIEVTSQLGQGSTFQVYFPR